MGARAEEASRLKVVVSDTGPILHLRDADALDVLAHVGEVIIPAAVEEEVLRLIDDWPTTRPLWIKRRALDLTQSALVRARELVSGLGAGETEAILLARQIDADWLLTDDAEARVIAALAGIEVHGSLGVVLWAAATGHFDLAAVRAALDGLANSSLWVSDDILAEARAALPGLTEQP